MKNLILIFIVILLASCEANEHGHVMYNMDENYFRNGFQPDYEEAKVYSYQERIGLGAECMLYVDEGKFTDLDIIIKSLEFADIDLKKLISDDISYKNIEQALTYTLYSEIEVSENLCDYKVGDLLFWGEDDIHAAVVAYRLEKAGGPNLIVHTGDKVSADNKSEIEFVGYGWENNLLYNYIKIPDRVYRLKDIHFKQFSKNVQ